MNFFPKFTLPSSSTHSENTYIGKDDWLYNVEAVEVGLVRAFPRLLEDGLNHIVPILVKQHILEDTSVLLKILEE
jgi:hypothetical protein